MVDLFRDVTLSRLKELESTTSVTSCPAGKMFYFPNQPGEVIFILKKGRVKLYRMSAEGRKLLLRTLQAGTVFGEMVLVGPGVYDTFAEAVEDSVLCFMSRRSLEALISSNPKVAVRLLHLIGQRLRDTEERLEETVFHQVPSRVARLLLRLRSESGSNFIFASHEELAEHLGVYRETITMALNGLKREGLLSIRRMQLELKDPAGLERKAAVSCSVRGSDHGSMNPAAN